MQEAFLQALRRPPADESELLAWLGVLARHEAVRSGIRDDNRRERERSVASAEDYWAEAPEARERVSEVRRLLENLPDPYREVLQLRYIDELEIDEIAQRLGRSRGTVGSQIKRGLDRLRARMGPEERERSAVRGLLLFFRRRRLGPQARLTACAALVCLGALAVLPRWHARGVASADRVIAEAGRSSSLSPPLEPAESERRVAADTGSDGRATLSVLPAAPNPAGARNEWPTTVQGRVLGPDDVPLAHAALWVGEMHEAVGRQVGHCDEAGRFELEGLDGRLWFWADTDLHRPSTRHLLASVRRERELVLTTGEPLDARLARVVNSDGIAVAGATVTVLGASLLTQPAFGDQGTIEKVTAEYQHTVQTSADGTFAFGLGSNGGCHLMVQADGAPSTLFTFDGRGLAPRRDLVLPRGGTLRGRVSSEEGSPLAHARLRLDLPRPHAPLETWTNQLGEFYFSAVPAGRHELVASPATGQTLASRQAGELREGAIVTRDIRLGASSTLGGIVLWKGTQVAGWTVELERTRTDLFPDGRLATTGADGRFEFSACLPGEEYLVIVRAPGEDRLRWAGVQRVGEGSEQAILVDDAEWNPSSLRGTIDAEPEDIPSFVELWSEALMRRWTAPVDPLTGAYTFAPVPPGSYVLLAWTRRLGTVTVQSLTLSPGQDERFDTTMQAPGVLRARFQVPPGLAASRVDIVWWGRSMQGSKPFGMRALSRSAPQEFTGELPPGEHEYRLRIDGQVFDTGHVTVTSGHVTDVVVAIPLLVEVELVLGLPRPLLEWDDLEVIVRAERELKFKRGRSPFRPEDRLPLRLPVETWEIEVRSDSGLFGVWRGRLETVKDSTELLLPLEELEPAPR